MIHEASSLSILVFLVFAGRSSASASTWARAPNRPPGYFAAGGGIHWAVNGVAFAGDYLSAASFLGICGMIAFYGYDGFLYSIGYLAGWIVALFVIAEPLKRLGRFTFADALDNQFNSRGIKLAAAISTLVVSCFYLIPQMVGAGALVQPLLGFPHYVGVLLVGCIVTLHRDDGGHGLDHLGAVHQGHAAGGPVRGHHRADSAAWRDHQSAATTARRPARC